MAPAEADGDPTYWLGIGQASDAVAALSRAPSSLSDLFDRYPILALPELPRALEARAAAAPPDAARAYTILARTLRDIAAAGRAEQPASYATLLANCGLVVRDAGGGEPARNLRRARALFAEARVLADADQDLAAALLNEEAIVCRRLAALGLEPEAHLRTAVALYRRARERGATGSELAGWLMNEANALEELAELGVDAVTSLEAAAALRRQAQSLWPPSSPELRDALLREARIRYVLAERAIDARANLEQVITLTLAARDAGLTEPGELAMSCLHEAMARVQLAQRAVDVRHHAEEALRLCERARSLAPADAYIVGAALLETGNAHQLLGRLAGDARTGLDTADRQAGESLIL